MVRLSLLTGARFALRARALESMREGIDSRNRCRGITRPAVGERIEKVAADTPYIYALCAHWN